MWYRFCTVCGSRLYVGREGYCNTIGLPVYCSEDCEQYTEEDEEGE